MNRSALNLVDFNEVKEDFLPTLLDINQRFATKQDAALLQVQAERYRKEFRGAVDTLGASTPNAEKEKLKKPLKDVLVTMPDYHISVDLHTTLTSGH